MTKKYLAFGYDTERPYGALALSEEGREFRKGQIGFVRRMNAMFDEKDVPRTYFLLGNYLESCLLDFDKGCLRTIYNKENPLIEIQQHTYSHPIIRPIKGRLDKHVFTPKQFGMDVKMAAELINEILGVQTFGLRTPIGYHQDLSDKPQILEELRNHGIKYVSSHLRSERTLEGPLTKDRQPHDYNNIMFPELIEIPSHGWQDVVFTKEKAKIFLEREPDGPEEIIHHYSKLFSKANDIDLPIVTIALAFTHGLLWSMMPI